jgi:hypothetical protein
VLHPGRVRRVLFSPDGRTLLTVGNREARLWNVVEALAGTPEQLRMKVEAETGQELDEAGAARTLTDAEVRRRQ